MEALVYYKEMFDINQLINDLMLYDQIITCSNQQLLLIWICLLTHFGTLSYK